jgi:hypothetical protein
MESERVVMLPIEKIVVPEGRFRRNLGDLNDLAREFHS